MKFCPECGSKLTDRDTKHCTTCGTAIVPRSAAERVDLAGIVLTEDASGTTSPERQTPAGSKEPPSRSSGVAIAGIGLARAGMLMPYFASVFLVPVGLICSLIAYKRGHRAMGLIGIAFGVFGVIGIIYTSQQISEVARDPFGATSGSGSSPASAPSTPPLVTKGEYDQITDGMTYTQAVGIIGR
jgi:hypothetical protein